MKKTIAGLVLSLMVTGVAFADVSDPIYANGSPEAVVNVWGTNNSQIPTFKPGETKVLSNGVAFICPLWFGNIRCVDVTVTNWFKVRN